MKVLDSGLAKLAEPLSATDNNEGATLATTPGLIVGTVAYMSPEQRPGHVRTRAVGPRHNSRRVGAIDLIDTQILRVYDTRYGLAGTGIRVVE